MTARNKDLRKTGTRPATTKVYRHQYAYQQRKKEAGQKSVRVFVDIAIYEVGYQAFEPNVEMVVPMIAHLDSRSFVIGWHKARMDWLRKENKL